MKQAENVVTPPLSYTGRSEKLKCKESKREKLGKRVCAKGSFPQEPSATSTPKRMGSIPGALSFLEDVGYWVEQRVLETEEIGDKSCVLEAKCRHQKLLGDLLCQDSIADLSPTNKQVVLVKKGKSSKHVACQQWLPAQGKGPKNKQIGIKSRMRARS